MIDNILIVDTETTGLDTRKGDQIIEIAAVLFNLKYKTVLQQFATLLKCSSNPVEKINHIKAEATQVKFSTDCMNNVLKAMLKNADVCVAHNAEFDQKFIATLGELGLLFLEKPWVCTKGNFTWPVPLPRLRLEDICVAMKVPYVNAHRALADCLLLAQCFEKVDDLEERFSNFYNQ